VFEPGVTNTNFLLAISKHRVWQLIKSSQRGKSLDLLSNSGLKEKYGEVSLENLVKTSRLHFSSIKAVV